jgi:hypothetical protein
MISHMSWEAFRLTSKSPSELYDVLGPEGPDNLVRQFLTACWNALPAGERSFAAWRKLVAEVYARNNAVWSRIKKPNPAAFFENLRPDPADGHLRQAFVLTWMMLPRAGGRDIKDARRVVDALYERNVAAWESDNTTFTKGPGKSTKKPADAKSAGNPAAKKKTPSRAKRVAKK